MDPAVYTANEPCGREETCPKLHSLEGAESGFKARSPWPLSCVFLWHRPEQETQAECPLQDVPAATRTMPDGEGHRACWQFPADYAHRQPPAAVDLHHFLDPSFLTFGSQGFLCSATAGTPRKDLGSPPVLPLDDHLGPSQPTLPAFGQWRSWGAEWSRDITKPTSPWEEGSETKILNPCHPPLVGVPLPTVLGRGDHLRSLGL